MLWKHHGLKFPCRTKLRPVKWTDHIDHDTLPGPQQDKPTSANSANDLTTSVHAPQVSVRMHVILLDRSPSNYFPKFIKHCFLSCHSSICVCLKHRRVRSSTLGKIWWSQGNSSENRPERKAQCPANPGIWNEEPYSRSSTASGARTTWATIRPQKGPMWYPQTIPSHHISVAGPAWHTWNTVPKEYLN